MKRLSLILALVAMALQLNAQDLSHYQDIIKELSSKKYQGRGYAEDGANKAGKWIAKKFERVGADDVECQPFTLNINTFPGKMDFFVDGRRMTPGVDFTLREFNPGRAGCTPSQDFQRVGRGDVGRGEPYPRGNVVGIVWHCLCATLHTCRNGGWRGVRLPRR